MPHPRLHRDRRLAVRDDMRLRNRHDTRAPLNPQANALAFT
ncbi:hypothetical protein LP422_23400 [Janibacter limosus]|nr:hypothetical protein LP422_23400 [Janibacter limosus]